MKKYEIDFERLQKRHDHPSIKYLAMSGVKADLLERCHAVLRMPLGDLHVNHVGTAYAGSIFVLIEYSAAALFFCSCGEDEWVPIVRNVTVDYLKPATTDIIAEPTITQKELAERMDKIEQRGRGSFPVAFPVRDAEGNEIARATVVLYILPLKKADN